MWPRGLLAYNGVITGSSDQPELRKAKEATGWKEYAIKTADGNVPPVQSHGPVRYGPRPHG